MRLNDTAITHRNPQASENLIIPVRLVPTVPTEKSQENFRLNIERKVPWLDESPAHGRVAVICGAAPSLKDGYSDIQSQLDDGAVLFACNSAAGILDSNGLNVDYQVMLDPSELVVDEICLEADQHLFASIVPPAAFEKVKKPILWHPFISWLTKHLESDPRSFTYIGGGISVGISAMCIAYTMGYREIHIYGMDSSYDGERFYANDAQAAQSTLKITVEENGKTYNTTYDMKQQVLVFFAIEKALVEAGCKVNVHGSGLLPETWAKRKAESSATQLLEE